MARKLSISFKETTRDVELYIYLDALEDRSAWIKSILRKAVQEEKEAKKI